MDLSELRFFHKSQIACNMFWFEIPQNLSDSKYTKNWNPQNDTKLDINRRNVAGIVYFRGFIVRVLAVHSTRARAPIERDSTREIRTRANRQMHTRAHTHTHTNAEKNVRVCEREGERDISL